jgi:YHS domain-containing protein
MTIGVSQAPFSREHDGLTYHFCSLQCASRFESDAEAYAAAARLQLPGWGATPHPEHIARQFRTDLQKPGT